MVTVGSGCLLDDARTSQAPNCNLFASKRAESATYSISPIGCIEDTHPDRKTGIRVVSAGPVESLVKAKLVAPEVHLDYWIGVDQPEEDVMRQHSVLRGTLVGEAFRPVCHTSSRV